MHGLLDGATLQLMTALRLISDIEINSVDARQQTQFQTATGVIQAGLVAVALSTTASTKATPFRPS